MFIFLNCKCTEYGNPISVGKRISSVGTEINLVERLAREQEGRIRVEALRSSACSNMAKITPEKLRDTLEGIVAGNTDPITVPSEDSAPAKASLERMLEACA